MTDFFIIYQIGRLFERIKSKEAETPDFPMISTRFSPEGYARFWIETLQTP
ncbi:hypothetical protein [Vibrio breoganii]|uniref:hypothetical protein n=1 Tax=Vibrio breoganii TaxID=553239 RepID=UPI0012FFF25B|nr:hypothetical protein [Vibrio breoganii]